MTGIVRYGKHFGCQEIRLLGLPVLAVTLPEKIGWRQRLFSLRAAQLVARKGIRECSFPENFTQKEIFRRKGIQPVDRLPLLREKAGQWVLAERQARGLEGSIALAVPRMTKETERAIELLLKKAGRVDLLPVSGAEALQRRLRRESGAPLRLITEEQLARCETLLDFGNCGAEGAVLTLRMGEKTPFPRFLLPEKLRKELPPWASEDDFCVLLRGRGSVAVSEIGVKSRK